MPYKLFRQGGKYCAKNTFTGKITHYSSEQKRANGIRVKEAFSHHWHPTHVKTHSRVSKRGRIHNVNTHWRK